MQRPGVSTPRPGPLPRSLISPRSPCLPIVRRLRHPPPTVLRGRNLLGRFSLRARTDVGDPLIRPVRSTRPLCLSLEATACRSHLVPRWSRLPTMHYARDWFLEVLSVASVAPTIGKRAVRRRLRRFEKTFAPYERRLREHYGAGAAEAIEQRTRAHYHALQPETPRFEGWFNVLRSRGARPILQHGGLHRGQSFRLRAPEPKEIPLLITGNGLNPSG